MFSIYAKYRSSSTVTVLVEPVNTLEEVTINCVFGGVGDSGPSPSPPKAD